MDKMKEKLGQFKEFAGKLSSKTKKLIIAGAAVLIVGAIVIALVLNNRPYGVLFTGLNSDEAKQITTKLQEDGVDFQLDGNSTILVKESELDQTKATLVQEGYPKSGFTYDTFTENAGLMTTDSDKKTYKLYELQDRIGATIRLFDGVKDAKVNIALGEESKYALSDDEGEKASATAVVIMEDGSSPTEEQAAAIQRLVAKSVPKMELTDVAVFDGNGNDVSTEEGVSSANSSDAEEIAAVVQNQIANNVMKVLGPIYGQQNVRVSARAQINMEKLVRESTTYNTPEKIDDEDKTGIVKTEETYNEGAGGGNAAGGVAGSETNADTAEYDTDGTTDGANAYSESASREYLVDQIIEQGQVDSGALEDLTVSVAINGNGYGSLNETQLRALVSNASGIAVEDRADKITIVSAPFDGIVEETDAEPVSGFLATISRLPVWVFILLAIAVLALGVAVFVLLARRKRKALELEEAEIAAELAASEESEEVPVDMNQELQELQNDKGMELKKSIREFAEQNAEISAQLLKTWLNGGGANGE